MFCQVAGLISSVIVLVTVLKIGSLFSDLPKVTLLIRISLCKYFLMPYKAVGSYQYNCMHFCSLGCLIHNSVCEFERHV